MKVTSRWRMLSEPLLGYTFGYGCLLCQSPRPNSSAYCCKSCEDSIALLGKNLQRPSPDVYSLFPLQEVTRKLVHGLKYEGMGPLAEYMVEQSQWVYGTVLPWELSSQWALVPVPVHRARMRERGYNQALILAKALQKGTQAQLITNCLYRTGSQDSQTKLGAESRQQNVASCFKTKGKSPSKVILVDDVYTTGATTGACAMALGQSGAKQVITVTLVYDQPASPKLDYWMDDQSE